MDLHAAVQAAGMAVFDEVWGMASGTMKKRGSSVVGARRELFRAICLSPLFFTSLSAGISPCITASDASGTGGAWATSSSLTDEGKNFVEAIHLLEEEGECAPILVISLFNGIGGAFRCYDVAGIPVAGESRSTSPVKPTGLQVKPGLQP